MNKFNHLLDGYKAVANTCFGNGINPMPTIRADLKRRGLGHIHVQFIRYNEPDDQGIYVCRKGNFVNVFFFQHEDILADKIPGEFYNTYLHLKRMHRKMQEPLWGYGHR